MAIVLDGTNGETFPSWTTATRPASPANGQMGYNTTTGKFDQYTAAGWTSVSTQTTGQVLQVVQGTSTAGDVTAGSTYVATSLSASITPSSATSKIFVLVTSIGTITATGGQANFTIYRNSTNLGGGAQSAFSQSYNSNGYIFAALSMAYLDSPATTSATTYAPYIKGNGANTYFGSANITSTIVLMEIAA
jgi:hypothetical protein